MLTQPEVIQLNIAHKRAVAQTATRGELLAAARLFGRERLWGLFRMARFMRSDLVVQRDDFARGDGADLIAQINSVLDAAGGVASAPAQVVAGVGRLVLWTVLALGAGLALVVYFLARRA